MSNELTEAERAAFAVIRSETPCELFAHDIGEISRAVVAAVRPILAAEAWDDGYRYGVDDERTSSENIGIAGFDMKINPGRNNPYRDNP